MWWVQRLLSLLLSVAVVLAISPPTHRGRCPAHDGGFTMLCVPPGTDPAVFENIEWSTSRTCVVAILLCRLPLRLMLLAALCLALCLAGASCGGAGASVRLACGHNVSTFSHTTAAAAGRRFCLLLLALRAGVSA
jgi:hypothetical protein